MPRTSIKDDRYQKLQLFSFFWCKAITERCLQRELELRPSSPPPRGRRKLRYSDISTFLRQETTFKSLSWRRRLRQTERARGMQKVISFCRPASGYWRSSRSHWAHPKYDYSSAIFFKKQTNHQQNPQKNPNQHKTKQNHQQPNPERTKLLFFS